MAKMGGCDNQDILEHRRGPMPHVAGCWVIDLLIGKKEECLEPSLTSR